MAWLKHFNQFLLLLFETFRCALVGRIWVILFGYFLVGWIPLWILNSSFSPISFSIADWLVGLLGEDVRSQFFHYPNHFLYLPYVFGWTKLVLTVLFEGLFLGGAAILFRRFYLQLKPKEWRTAGSVLGSWGNLVIVSVVVNGLNFLASYFIPQVLQGTLSGNPRRVLFFELVAMPILYTLIAALFLCAIPVIALYKENAWNALKRSIMIFIHRPFTCFFLAAIIWAVPILIGAAANHPEVITEKFYPELVYWVVLSGLFFEMIAYFIWMGTTVRLLVEDEK